MYVYTMPFSPLVLQPAKVYLMTCSTVVQLEPEARMCSHAVWQGGLRPSSQLVFLNNR